MAARRGTGTVYPDPTRSGYVGEVTLDGKRRRIRAATRKEAGARLKDLIAAHAAGTLAADRNMTVGDLLDDWLENAAPNRNPAPRTMEAYRWAIGHLRDHLGSKRVANVDATTIEAALRRMRDEGLSKGSLVKVKAVAGMAWAYAVRRRVLTTNWPALAEMPTGAKTPAARRALTPDEARKLLDALRRHPRGLMYELMLVTGMRLGEAAGLTWADVDLDDARVTVRHSIRLVDGRPVLADALKTARSLRVLGLPVFLVGRLREHRTSQVAERLAARRWEDERLVFATNVGTPLEPARIRHNLSEIAEAAGVGELRPNELRHSAASIMSDSGVPLEVIADQLGHASTRMLAQTYRKSLRPSIDAGAEVAERLYSAQ